MKKFLVPILGFGLLIGLFAFAILKMQSGEYSPRHIPSPLVGKPLPAFALPLLEKPARTLTQADFKGRVTLINVWASWCVACKEEHPVLMELVRNKQATFVGLNYKDKHEDALAVLAQDGNPYALVLVDADGRAGINWGVYGVPETFVVDKAGMIRYKHVGPIRQDVWYKTLAPIVHKLEQEQPAG